MSLSYDELRDIGEQAAREVIGNIDLVEVTSGTDGTGHPAYFFDLSLQQDRDRARASLLRTRLRQNIRDRLLAERDARYPYVRIHGIQP